MELSGGLTGLCDLRLESFRRGLILSCFLPARCALKPEFSRQEKADTARGAALLMRNRLLRN